MTNQEKIEKCPYKECKWYNKEVIFYSYPKKGEPTATEFLPTKCVMCIHCWRSLDNFEE